MDKDLSKLSKEELKAMTIEKASNVLFNLEQAYKVKPEDLSFEEEKMLLEAMSKAKKFKEEIIRALNEDERKEGDNDKVNSNRTDRK